MDKDFLSTDELCRRAAASRQELRMAIVAELLTPAGRLGRSRVFRPEDVARLKEAVQIIRQRARA